MADVAHDASGPASSEPASIALQQASGPASSVKGKLRVFISYSRDDFDFADQLSAALDFSGFECFIDREGISGGEAWKRRLGNLISEADTVVFVLSPTSARSDTCNWEVEEAARLNKRILPIICRPLDGVSPPPRLRDLNYIHFYKEPKVPGSGFGTGLAKLVTALNTDFDWLREHTRYLQRAMEWDKGGRPANRLLSGNDILEAKAWVARRPKGAPEPTALQLDFIRASGEEAEARLSEQRKQLEAMAAAQAERETALHDREEALKQRARVARVRNLALVVVSILLVLAGWLGWSADQQRNQAEVLLDGATKIIVDLWSQLDSNTKKQAFALFETGAKLGDPGSMKNLGRFYAYGHGVPQDYAKAREWYEKAAAETAIDVSDYHAQAMYSLGVLYHNGSGVPQDYAKAREWYEKAAAKGDAYAMANLGVLYHNGSGVPQDYAKAREWYEKAAAKDHAQAMGNLGVLFHNGSGVAQDYAKAREWYEKAAAKGNEDAKQRLERLSISEARATGRYAEALRHGEALVAIVEAVETKRDGKPGEQTAWALQSVAWSALFAQEFPKALTAADRAHALFPDDLGIETNRAHALIFMERGEEAKALYLAHKGKPLSDKDNRLWERVITDDFEKFRKAGLTHPMMADIEKELGVSPDGNSDIGQR
jgi:TIR domain/Sel1 repeat